MATKLERLRNKLEDLVVDLETHKATYEHLDRDATDDELKRANDIMDQMESVEKSIQVEERAIKTMDKFTGTKKTPEIDIVEEPKDRGFKTFGEFLTAVVRAENPNVKKDERLLEVRGASGMSEGVAADGGYLVGKQQMEEVLKIAYETGQLAKMVRRIPIGANANGIKINYIDETSRVDGSRWGGIRGYWTPEAAALTASKPKFGQIDMSLAKLTCLYYATDELLADSVALGDICRQGFGEEIGFKLDDAIINGTGAGMPQGILNAACKVEVAEESSQASDTIVAENIEKMYARMWGRGKSNGVWLINGDCWPQIFNLVRSVTTGQIPLYMPPNGLAGIPYSTLMGRPIIEIEQCPTVGDAGAVIFADMSQYILIEKGDPQYASSMHVRFLYDEMTFRVTYRANGQAAWASARTPFKGSNTRSPFITLGAT